MTRFLVSLTVAATTATLVAACTDDPVVLATVRDGEHEEGPGTRCVDDRDCKRGSFCERRSCNEPAGTCAAFPVSCADDEMPVCGCDGVTYFNDCLRRAAGASKAQEGECQRDALTCQDLDDCPEGASCAKLVGSDPGACGPDTVGRCWLIPANCPPPTRSDRWSACTPEHGPPPLCRDTCNAIRSGEPHHRALHCE